MEADLVECAFGDRAQSRRDFDAEYVSREHLAPAGVLLRADGEHRRQHAGGCVDDTAAMGVVEIEAVNQNAVDQRRIAQRQPRRHADDGEIAGARKAGNGCHRPVREVIAGRGERDADRIENQVLGACGHRGRDCRGRERADKARELFGDERAWNGFRVVGL